MHLNISQQMKMSQQMKLAPRMIQSMEILQLPVMALNERIEQELSENVLLEIDTKQAEKSDTEVEREAERAREEANEIPSDQKELVVDNDSPGNEDDFERLVEIASEWSEDNVSFGSRPSSNRIDEMGDRKHDSVANMESKPQSLHEYLMEQFGFFNCAQEIRDFSEYLIQNLDHNGRLQSSLPEIVQVYGKTIELERAEEALYLIQKLDPPGVGARNVKECLLLQVRPETHFREVVITLIESHLEDLAQNQLPAIERKTGYSIDLIKSAFDELLEFEPYPGRDFAEVTVQKVTPDLAIKQNDEGKYLVELIDEYTPSLRISNRYLEMLKGKPDKKTKEYIKQKIDSAKWLIDSIEQRNSTVKRVAQAIVDHQTGFLDNGPEYIIPLKMQQIADIVEVHVTTVSRAVDDKWIQTPRGIFPLKRFFGGGTKTTEGEDVAWDIIRIKLQEIIDAEDKDKPLSDEALVKELAKQGYKLARRTITKYRKAMNIPSSRQRREY